MGEQETRQSVENITRVLRDHLNIDDPTTLEIIERAVRDGLSTFETMLKVPSDAVDMKIGATEDEFEDNPIDCSAGTLEAAVSSFVVLFGMDQHVKNNRKSSLMAVKMAVELFNQVQKYEEAE